MVSSTSIEGRQTCLLSFLSLVLHCYRWIVNGILKFVGAGEFRNSFLEWLSNVSDLVLLLLVFSSESGFELSETALTLFLLFYVNKEKGGRWPTFQSGNPKGKRRVKGHCNIVLHKIILGSFKFKENV